MNLATILAFLVPVKNRGKLYYDGEHKDVTDGDIIVIPQNQRITSKKYKLTIYPNKNLPKYIYYVRFKGTVIAPVIQVN